MALRLPWKWSEGERVRWIPLLIGALVKILKCGCWIGVLWREALWRAVLHHQRVSISRLLDH